MDSNDNKKIKNIKDITESEYKFGFETQIIQEFSPKGLNEDIVRYISNKKNEPKFMLDFRLKSFRAWMKMREPRWGKISYSPIDYQDAYY